MSYIRWSKNYFKAFLNHLSRPYICIYIGRLLCVQTRVIPTSIWDVSMFYSNSSLYAQLLRTIWVVTSQVSSQVWAPMRAISVLNPNRAGQTQTILSKQGTFCWMRGTEWKHVNPPSKSYLFQSFHDKLHWEREDPEKKSQTEKSDSPGGLGEGFLIR